MATAKIKAVLFIVVFVLAVAIGCNALIGMMNDHSADIRAACAAALGQLRDDRADTYLRYHMDHETDEKVIAALHEALGMLHHH